MDDQAILSNNGTKASHGFAETSRESEQYKHDMISHNQRNRVYLDNYPCLISAVPAAANEASASEERFRSIRAERSRARVKSATVDSHFTSVKL